MKWFVLLLSNFVVFLAVTSPLCSQELIEYPAPVEEDFPAGYDLYDTSGKLLKTVPGPTRAKIQAYFEQEGRRLYLSDWSYERYKKQGIRPNLMVTREVDPQAMKFGQTHRPSKSPKLVEAARLIETAISKSDLDEAAELAARMESIAGDAGAAKKAATIYYNAVISFLAGDSDREVEAALKNALDLHSRENDVEGVWSSLYLLQKLYFDFDRNNSDLLTRVALDLSAVEKQVIRVRLGLAPDAGTHEIFERLLGDETLGEIKRNLDEVFLRLSAHPIHGEKIRRDQEDWSRNIEESLGLYGLGFDGQLARIPYYLEGRGKLEGVAKQFVGRAKELVSARLEVLTQIETTVVLSPKRRGSNSVVEGFNHSGGRWAYEFITPPLEPTMNLATDSAGSVRFADSEWVIRSVELDGSWGSQSLNAKTEISFYDTKTGRLVALISVPNRVFELGKIGGSSGGRFYIGTITPAKYMYEDCPLAITLVDLETESIERIAVVSDDYWLALGHELEIEASDGSLRLTVDKGTAPQYAQSQPKKEAFKAIRISFDERSRSSDGTDRWVDQESFKKQHREMVSNDLAGLSHLGPQPARIAAASSSRGQFAIDSPREPGLGIVLVRATEDGNLTRFDLGTLGRSSQTVSPRGVFAPFVLEDGWIACVADGGIQLLGKGTKRTVEIPAGDGGDLELSVKSPLSYYGPAAARLDFSRSTLAYTKDRKYWRMALPEADRFEALVLDPSVREIAGADAEIIDWNEKTGTFVVRNYVLGGFQRFQKSTGQLFGSRWNGGAQQVYQGLSSSDPTNGWRALSYVDESSTGGISSCVAIEKSADGSGHRIVANGLPSIADPLGLIDAGANLRVLFGSGDTVRFIEVDPTSGATKAIWLRNFANRFGKALFDPSSSLLLIPSASGFEAWMLPSEGEPSKKFDLLLADDDTFVVLLSNGLYAGSPGCERLLRFGSIDGASVAAWRNRPAEVLKVLGGSASEIEILEQVTDRWLAKLGNPERRPEPASEDFPTIALSSDVPLWAESGEVALAFDIKAGASPVKDLVVRVNGVDAQRGSNAVVPSNAVERRVKIAEGQNWIEAVAIDEQERSSNRVRFRTILRKSEKPSKRFIVAMGVSDYQNSNLNLEFAAKDASDLSLAIQTSFLGDSEILLLRNEEVTKKAPEQIRQFLARATENDEVVAFGAGHGVLDGNLDYYFCSHEFDPTDPASTCIRFDDLVDALSSTKALKRLLLLDTCHSGKVGEKDELLLAEINASLTEGVRVVRADSPKSAISLSNGISAAQQRRFIEEMFLLPGLHRGLTIIGASAGSQFALESAEWSNGVFTASILEALLGGKADFDGDAALRIGELRDYSGARVTELTRGAQTPSVVAFEEDQNFHLIKRPGGEFPETIIRNFYHAIESRDENVVSLRLADTVDYYKSGKISKKAVINDIIGDWKRYKEESYEISDFAKTGTSTFRFVLTYHVVDGNRPKGGNLQMEVTLSAGADPRITSLKTSLEAEP